MLLSDIIMPLSCSEILYFAVCVKSVLMPFLDIFLHVILAAGRPADVSQVNVVVIFSTVFMKFSKLFSNFTYLVGTERKKKIENVLPFSSLSVKHILVQ
jgi:hypothetical protein